MFDEVKHSLTLLFKDKELSDADGSYVANGRVFSIKKDMKNDHMTIKFSLLSTPDFNILVQEVEETIRASGFTFREIEKETTPINKIELIVCEKL